MKYNDYSIIEETLRSQAYTPKNNWSAYAKIENDSYFLGDVHIWLNPISDSHTEIMVYFDYFDYKLNREKYSLIDYLWLLNIDIKTTDPLVALEEIKKEKYRDRGTSFA